MDAELAFELREAQPGAWVTVSPEDTEVEEFYAEWSASFEPIVHHTDTDWGFSGRFMNEGNKME